MPSKPISRSMRFSEAIYSMIEQQAGENFSAKFENLVTKCCWELPRKEQELHSIERAIRERREQLGRMTNKIESYRRRIQVMDQALFTLEKQIAKDQEHEW